MATNATPDRRDVFEELFIKMSNHRPGDSGAEVATDLLRHERGPRVLVGLEADGPKAIFHDARARTLRAVPVTENGLSRTGGETLHRDLGAVTSWVRRHGDDLEWIHPRYRAALPSVRQYPKPAGNRDT